MLDGAVLITLGPPAHWCSPQSIPFHKGGFLELSWEQGPSEGVSIVLQHLSRSLLSSFTVVTFYHYLLLSDLMQLPICQSANSARPCAAVCCIKSLVTCYFRSNGQCLQLSFFLKKELFPLQTIVYYSC